MGQRDGILLLEDLIGSKVGNVCCNLLPPECLAIALVSTSSPRARLMTRTPSFIF